MRHTAIAACALALLAGGCGGRPADGTVVAVIQSTQRPFFADLASGIRDTARRLHTPLVLETRAGTMDPTAQASRLEALAAKDHACYVVDPVTPTNLIPGLAHLRSDTPVVDVDAPLDEEAADSVGIRVVSRVATDNVAAGRLAARALTRAAGRGARVALIAGVPGEDQSDARVAGFLDQARGRLHVVRTVAADDDRHRARLAADELLRADPGLRGIYVVSTPMTLGVTSALRGNRRVVVIGTGGNRVTYAALRRGALAATIARYPYVMGRLAVQACEAALRGRRVPARVDAPVEVIDRARVDRAQMRGPQPVGEFRDPFARLLGG
jgi:ABC-type sugar transport system substrate-binding protein